MTSRNTTTGFVRALRRKRGDGAKEGLAPRLAAARAAPDMWPSAPPMWSSPSEPTVRLKAGPELGDVTRYIYEHWHEGPARTGPTPRLTDISVERIQNLRQWRQHELFSESLQPPAAASSSAAGSASPRWLFHGAPTEVVPNIIAQGFNRSYCGRVGTIFGRGVYFARSAKYACNPLYAKPDPKTGVQ
eukprot:7384111-Prymnesium_polylepis.2